MNRKRSFKKDGKPKTHPAHPETTSVKVGDKEPVFSSCSFQHVDYGEGQNLISSPGI